MKVLMVNTFHHTRGGDARYTLTLSKLLEAAGHTVVPLAMRHPDNQPSIWEQRFVPWVDPSGPQSISGAIDIAKQMFWSNSARRTCRQLIEEVQPDVAHLQHVHRHITPSVLDALNEAGVPVVWTVHDHELICPTGLLFSQGEVCERCLGHRYQSAIKRRCKRGELLPSMAVAIEKVIHRAKNVWHRVDRFICPSAFLAQTLVRFGLPQDRVVHLPNFVDPDRYTPSAKSGSGWVYAGRLTDEKGVHVAIEAARQLPEHRFTICGTGPNEARLRQQAKDLPYVHFLGHLAPQHLAEVVRNASAVVVPSIWYENFPYAVLEAQVAGRAVVASNIGGIPEQIEDGVDGLLVPPGDPAALAQAVGPLLSSPKRAIALGRAGRRRVRSTLGPDAHKQRLTEIYAQVCRSRATQRRFAG